MILLVEDNEDDEELTLRAFQRHEIVNEVVIARTGEEALDFLFASGPYAGRDPTLLPLVTLLDLNLPKIDGIEVLRRLRADQRTRQLRVVVLTSSKQDEDAVANQTLGANSYIRKPINFRQLTEAVQPLGLSWLPLGAPPPHQSSASILIPVMPRS
jgi:two-component system response regulator